MNSSQTGFQLYANPSFCEGFARLIDFAGTLNKYNYSDSPKQADTRALLSDWENVGLDIKTAMEQFEQENGCSSQ